MQPVPSKGFTPIPASIGALQAAIERVFIGKQDVVQRALTTFLGGGHLLIEDVPGVGKTTLALSLAKATGCSFQRIQFTSDLLPADILGISLLNPKNQEFEFKKGAIFHQVILADELNRATPRTQSALLEAMNERQITVDNQTHPLPHPFFVVATQNPHEHHGAFPLPESQLDRFMMRITIGYPDSLAEKSILSQSPSLDTLQSLEAQLSVTEIVALMNMVPQVQVATVVDEYILSLVQATRRQSQISVGVSPRGALALRRACQAHALLNNRDYVTPDDVKALAVPVLAHRLIFTSEQISANKLESERVISSLLQTTPVPL